LIPLTALYYKLNPVNCQTLSEFHSNSQYGKRDKSPYATRVKNGKVVRKSIPG
jgi:hypothetical protein